MEELVKVASLPRYGCLIKFSVFFCVAFSLLWLIFLFCKSWWFGEFLCGFWFALDFFFSLFIVCFLCFCFCFCFGCRGLERSELWHCVFSVCACMCVCVCFSLNCFFGKKEMCFRCYFFFFFFYFVVVALVAGDWEGLGFGIGFCSLFWTSLCLLSYGFGLGPKGKVFWLIFFLWILKKVKDLKTTFCHLEDKILSKIMSIEYKTWILEFMLNWLACLVCQKGGSNSSK